MTVRVSVIQMPVLSIVEEKDLGEVIFDDECYDRHRALTFQGRTTNMSFETPIPTNLPNFASSTPRASRASMRSATEPWLSVQSFKPKRRFLQLFAPISAPTAIHPLL